MNKLKIGLVTNMTVRSHVGMGIAYVRFCEEIARRAEKTLNLVLIHHTNDFIKDLDILILPGGADVDPALYDEELSSLVGRLDPQRDFFTRNVLPLYVESKTPIFGICRGHQELAAHFGMKLIQDKIEPLSEYVFGAVIEKVELKNFFNTHASGAKKGEYILIKDERVNHIMDVNSRHHQCVKVCDTEKAVVTAALGKIDSGRIEAMEYIGYPIVSVQWHPEILFDTYTMRSIELLLEYEKKD
jgi:putative glutamine amidotransferase